MKPSEAAYLNLVALARIDGVVTSTESALLERYREALGVSETFSDDLLQKKGLKPLSARKLEGTARDRKHVLKMMVRVAYADGAISGVEKRLLKRVARTLSIGPFEFASIIVGIGQELGLRRRLRLSQIAAAATVLAAAIVLFLVFDLFSTKTDRKVSDTRLTIDELRTQLDLEREQAEEALQRVRRTQEDLAREEAALTERLKELEAQAAKQQEELETSLTARQERRNAELAEEIDRLRGELARVRNRSVAFKMIEKEYGGSILLIFLQYDLVSGSDRITRASMGTGFFVTSSGHIVSNKHVVQPWKFSGTDIMLLDMGYTLDKDSMFISAWPAGVEFRDDSGALSLKNAYTTAEKKLLLEVTTPDTFIERVGMLDSGGVYKGKYHVLDESDLAVLKAKVTGAVKALPLASAAIRIEKLDPVMVLGFPYGLNILETKTAETSPSIGEVRKIQKSIMVTAPIVPGNSGGPLMDIHSNVVGVASKTYGDATLGSCIPARHILPLLPKAPDLLIEIAAREAAGEYRAALDDLHLAELRCGDEKEREMVRKKRARLLEIRDGMIEEALGKESVEERKKAFQEIVNLFGRRWAGEAAEGP